MRIISTWARHHIWATRFFIILTYVFLNIIGLALGDMLSLTGLQLPVAFFYTISLLVVIGVIFYPSKKRKGEYRNFYAAQKTCDVILAASTFLLIVYSGNTINAISANTADNAYAALVTPNTTEPAVEKNIHPIKKFMGLFSKNKPGKEWVKKLKHNLRELRKQYKNSSESNKVVRLILAIMVTILLVLLLAVLACGIACSGSEALAYIALAVGLAGITLLMIRVIKSIIRDPDSADKPNPKRTPSEPVAYP